MHECPKVFEGKVFECQIIIQQNYRDMTYARLSTVKKLRATVSNLPTSKIIDYLYNF